MKKGDVGMANRFSKKYGNKGWAFNYLWIKDAYQHLMLHPYITASREQAAKTDMLSVVSIQVFCTVKGVANACIWLTQPPWSWKSTTLAEYKGNGTYLRNPLTQGWLQAS